jgi:hypothetical protein
MARNTPTIWLSSATRAVSRRSVHEKPNLRPMSRISGHSMVCGRSASLPPQASSVMFLG